MMNRTEREKRFRREQEKRGYKQVRLWIPKNDVERARDYARRLRDAHRDNG